MESVRAGHAQEKPAPQYSSSNALFLGTTTDLNPSSHLPLFWQLSTNVFNSGLGLPSYPVARIQVSMSCNFGWSWRQNSISRVHTSSSKSFHQARKLSANDTPLGSSTATGASFHGCAANHSG